MKQSQPCTQDKPVSTAVEAQFAAQKIAFAPVIFQAAKALRDLGILELLLVHRATGLTIEDIKKQLDLPVYAIKILLDIGITVDLIHLLEKKYTASKVGYFIAKDELTRVNMDFTHDVCYQGLFHLQEALQTGQPAGLKVFSEWSTIYEALSSLPAQVQKSWFGFDHYYSDIAFPEVLPLVFKDEPKVIFDVGGNTGKWAQQCAQHNPDVHIKIIDLPGQLATAEKQAAAQGFADRISTAAVNMLDPNQELPSHADAIWMSQFLDCFSPEQIINILKKAKKAMQPHSTLFILETYTDRQRFPASTYSLHATSLYFTCMANGNSKMYSATEMLQYIEAAGLRLVEETDHIGMGHTLFKCCL